MKIDYTKILRYISLICLISFIGYGAYRWYFARPPQVVNQNTYMNTTVEPGANQTIQTYVTNTTKQKLNSIGVFYIPESKEVGISYSRFF